MTQQRHAAQFPLLPQVLNGQTADVYFLRTRDALAQAGLDPMVGMEIFPPESGLFCGGLEVKQLLETARFEGEIWMLEEGERVEAREAAVEIFGRYSSFGIYETAVLGILSSCTGWATAARALVDAAGGVPVTSFGARHLHPNVAPLLDYASVVGGCVSCSTSLGAALAGVVASGTMPHAFLLTVGDTLQAAELFDRAMPADVPRIVLVDTFQDEAVESLRVARALREALHGVRLDTPAERGGVTAGLVREVRARLDLEGFRHVEIFVSGGMTPDRLRQFADAGAPVNGYGIGGYIAGAPPIAYTADIREIEGRPVVKRGRIPGMQRSPRLERVQ